MADSTARLGWKTTRDEEHGQWRIPLPKNLISTLRYRITKAGDLKDLISCPPVHAGTRDGV
jgi:hypothetical protein